MQFCKFNGTGQCQSEQQKHLQQPTNSGRLAAELAALFFTGGASFVAQAGCVGSIGAAPGATGAVVMFSSAALASSSGGVVAFFKSHNPVSQRRELNAELRKLQEDLNSCN